MLLFASLYSKMPLKRCLCAQYLYFYSTILTLILSLIRISSLCSTKIALIKVISDLLAAKPSGHVSVLILFYMWALCWLVRLLPGFLLGSRTPFSLLGLLLLHWALFSVFFCLPVSNEVPRISPWTIFLAISTP